jgi:hypothetical protein
MSSTTALQPLAAVGFAVGCGVATLVPLVAAGLGLGSRLRMIGQGLFSGLLALAWWVIAAGSQVQHGTVGEKFLGGVTLVFAAVAAFVAWNVDRRRRAHPTSSTRPRRR